MRDQARDEALDESSRRNSYHGNTVFVKLGGSVITNKRKAYTVRKRILTRLAAELADALAQGAVRRLVVGHGSGSFGHWPARSYGTRMGVCTPREWHGYAEVATAAGRLNRIVTDSFVDAGIPVLSLQPSASARCRDGVLEYIDTHPIWAALAVDIVPLVYGDVSLDEVRGGTIVSTEDIFVYLADQFGPSRVILVGEVPGVRGPDGRVLPCLSPSELPEMLGALGAAKGVDVTGGMADKVARMAQLVDSHPGTIVHLISGTEPGLLRDVLEDPSLAVGTRITSRQAHGPNSAR